MAFTEIIFAKIIFNSFFFVVDICYTKYFSNWTKPVEHGDTLKFTAPSNAWLYMCGF